MALRDTASPVRRFLDNRYPASRDLQRRYLSDAGPLLVPGSTAAPSTIGTAFDWMMRFMIHPAPALDLAAVGTFGFVGLRRSLVDLARLLRPTSTATADRAFAGPVPGTELATELLARGCWALALLTELYRVGLMPGSPLAALNLDDVTADQLLELATDDAVAELTTLADIARSALLPTLSTRAGLWSIGPTFAGSRLMNADADLICAGLLLEFKTNLGDKRPDGSRRPSLDRQTLLQLLGYTMLDFDDEFAITHAGIYNARYGQLTVWELPSLLRELADAPVDLPGQREQFRNLLTTGG